MTNFYLSRQEEFSGIFIEFFYLGTQKPIILLNILYGLKMKHIVILLSLVILSLSCMAYAADNTSVKGYKKPDVCLKSNIRCILKKQGDTMYWCLKSNLQRNLDTRRTTSPIKKTKREILGHCAKIITIHD